MSYDNARFTVCANAIVQAGKKLGAQGLTPATSSNFSMRRRSPSKASGVGVAWIYW